ncbi:MAG: hypothetical protein KatS3mg125_0374 [Lysobacterales bacterium]|nr:MAG: hypothetical protein KatS3mg125_0374 [Xanthomonadales bacterium]
MRFIAHLIFLALLASLPFSEGLAYQPGKNGNRTVTAANTVLNQYAELATSASVGDLSITVINIADLNSPETVGGGPLAPGDLILIYQATGASISTTLDHTFGAVTDYGSAGRYEIRSVAGVSGNTIQILPVSNGASCVGLKFAFAAGRTQVVRIPQYQNLDVQAGGSVVAQPWDGTRGGIVALFVDQTLTINGVIHADGRGFRGGVRENNDRSSGGTSAFAFASNATLAGGHKGEGIASDNSPPTNYPLLPFSNPGGSFDEAAAANGGGGGGSHNAGGGGGGNVAPSLTPYCTAGTATYDGTNPAITWCGQGIMPTAVSGPAAWTLDPGYIANGNTHTNHVGGGRGGYTFSNSDQDATTLAPGQAAWGGDRRRAKGGWGGRPLAYNLADRVFFGGGGGAGAMNNNAGGDGGRGGGLILIRAGTVVGSGTVSANGANGANTVPNHNDAPGGGGAGGSILIQAGGGNFSGTIRANGGNGGNQLITNNEAEGPGGGGGGGLVAVSGLASATLQSLGGAGGTTSSAALTEFPRNGATDGHPGVTTTQSFNLFTGCPSLSLAKTITSGSPYNAAGNVINYQIVATNTGNVTLTGVTITDPLLGTLSCSPAQPATLTPSQTLTCTGSYTVTQADVDAGSVVNTANASGTGPGGPVNAPPASATATANQNPALSLAKTITSGNPYNAAGNVINYQIVATNTGNVTLSGVTITDPLLGTLSCTPAQPATLAPAQTLTCTGSYTVTQANVDAGSVTNTANASGTAPGGGTINAPPASATATANQNPALSLAKTITSGNPYNAAGNVINYQIVATNTGNVTLTGVTITDPLLGTLSCSPAQPATLAPSQTLTCTGSYTVTQANVDAGSVTNTANASGTAPGGGTINAPPASATATANQNPALSLAKTITSGNPYNAAGNVINYQIVATNTGNVTLSGVTITDPLLGTLSCTPAQPATLAPAQTLTCIGSYTVTQADVDAGSVVNTANASGTGPGGPVNAPPASATANANQNPSLALTKTITGGNPYVNPGDVISYQLVATNTGNVTLSGVTITDPLLGALSCSPTQPATLAPSQTLTCTGSYTVTLADVNAGSVTNTANAAGTAPGGAPVNAPPASATATATQNPSLSLVKTITSGSPYNAPGNVISYQLVATNTGNVTLTNVTITDPLLGALSCTPVQPATLAPSQTLTCTGSYTVTQADVDAGSVTNTANASGTGPNGPVNAPPASATAVANQNAALNLVKTITSGSPYNAPGNVISYQLVATNTGNVTLTNVTITDPLLGALSCTPVQPATLAPSQTLTCSGSYTVTQANVDAGSVNNTATASGTRPGGGTVSAQAQASATATQNPGLSLSKTITSGNPYSAPGNVISYQLVATNTGNVTLTNVTITDPLLGTLSCSPVQPATLAPGQTLTCTGSYTVTQANVDAGVVTNTANAAGTRPGGGAVNAPPASATATANQNPGLSLSKTITSGNPYNAAGNVINYQIVATNTGNVTLSGVTITDPLLGTLSCTPVQPATLAPGQTLTCTGSYTVTQANVDAGSVTNTANASGTRPGGGSVNAPPASATATSNAGGPAIRLVKTASLADTNGNGVGDAGETINYTLTVTNIGPVTLSNVTVSDPLLPVLVCAPPQPSVLAPAQQMVCTGSYVLTSADVFNQTLTNTATAQGVGPAPGNVVVSSSSTVTVTLLGIPQPRSVPALGMIALVGLGLMLLGLGVAEARRRTG